MLNIQITKQHGNATTGQIKCESPAHAQISSPDFQMVQSCLLTHSLWWLRAVWKSDYKEVKASIHPTPQGNISGEYEVIIYFPLAITRVGWGWIGAL